MLEVERLNIGTRDALFVENLSIELARGRLTCLIGPSGCGKSSVIKWLSGVLAPELRATGCARFDGHEIALPHPGIAYQPQGDSLFPWLTVFENATLGLEIRGEADAAARDRVRGLFPIFGLQGNEDKFPDQLSGGMRQRAAFMRTMVQGARVLLLDEPFSALDAVTRLKMQDWLADRLEADPRAVLLVTHDLFEATQIADRVLVMGQHPARIIADIPLTIPRAARTEASLAGIRSTLKSMLLEDSR
ncbi:ABC transporter ATP-binding protein [Sulfitobacter alexandrii]|uniref:ABC transporter ATP-binding protein n=1 Tax=Sulfitobacter alexandrii TaxID=1917485 RepID=A0A1J0WK67_9RHOB|nr:ATP-binding cassette domain-containing protein [Sulfitobacter alexandrii]APE44568.1 ABC transporter ATP-binding protein [Sulfitobacter alexandrii]